MKLLSKIKGSLVKFNSQVLMITFAHARRRPYIVHRSIEFDLDSITMSSLKKDVSSPDVDDSDSDDDLEVEEMGPKSLAAFEGRPLLGRDIDSLEEVREMGPTSLKALAGSSEKSDLGSTVQQTDNNEDSLDLVVNMGPASMKALAAAQPNENSKKVNGKLKEGMPVPQPKPRRKPPAQEDKNLTDVHAENARLRGQKVELEQQLDRTKRDSDARAKQQEKMIGRLTAQLEVQSDLYCICT